MGVIEEILRIRDEASPALRGVAQEADSAAVGLADVVGGAGKVAAGLLAAGAAALAFQQKIADLRNDLGDMATRTGLAASTIAGLKLAAEGAGLGLSDVEGSIRGLNARIIALNAGSGEAVRGFQALGLTAEDVAAVPLDDTLRAILASLQEIEDPAERARAAMAVLGEEGTKLLQALSGGELDAFIDRAERFGVDIGPEAAAAAGEWQRSMADLRLVLEGAAATIADEIAPATSRWVDDFTTGVVAMTAYLRDGLIPALKDTLSVFGSFTAAEAAAFAVTLPVSAPMATLSTLQRAAPGVDAAAADVTALLGGGAPSGEDLAAALGLGSALTGPGGALAPVAEALGEAGPIAKVANDFDKALVELAAAMATAKEAAEEAQREREAAAARELDLIKLIARKREEALRQEEAAAAAAAEAAAQANAGAQAGAISGGDATANAIRQGFGIASQSLSNPLAALSMAGPGGAIAGGSLSLLAQIGQMGPEGVRDQFSGLVDAIVAGLEALPAILSDVLPGLVVDLVTQLPPAIAKSLFVLLAELLSFGLFNEDGKGGGFRRPVFNPETGEQVGSGRRDAERVAAARARGEERSARRGGVTVYGAITPAALDYLTRELDGAIGPRGRGLALGSA